MVIGVGIRNPEANRHFAQEWDWSVCSPDRGEIIAQAEDKLVDTGAQGIPSQEGTIGSSFGIGAHDV
jgi:hypothetical protein